MLAEAADAIGVEAEDLHELTTAEFVGELAPSPAAGPNARSGGRSSRTESPLTPNPYNDLFIE